jgi:hypothetical protein
VTDAGIERRGLDVLDAWQVEPVRLEPPPDVRDPRAASSDAQAELDGLGPGDHG